MRNENSKCLCLFRRAHAAIALFPCRALFFFALLTALAWIVQCSVFQNILPLDVVEAVSWGAQGAWGHAKHPPLSGWIAYGFSLLAGRKDWGLYLAAQLCILCGVFFIYLLARGFFDERRAAIVALLLYFVPYYNPSPMKFCTNFVEIAILPAMTYVFSLSLRRDRWYFWALFGVLAALGVLGKYSAVCVLGALFLLMLFRAEDREKLLSAGPFIALAAFLVVLSPHIVWLVRHDFSCFRYVGEELESTGHSPLFFFEVFAVSLHVFVLTAFALAVGLFPKRPHRVRPFFHAEPFRWGVLLCLVPALPLWAMALAGKGVVMMWFSSLEMWAPLAVVAVWPTYLSRRTFRRLFYWAIIYTAILFVVLTIDVAVTPRRKLHLEPEKLIAAVEKFRADCGVAPFGAVIGTRWNANSVENYAPHHPVSTDIEDLDGVERVLGKAEGKPVLLIHESSRGVLREFARSRFPGVPTREADAPISYRAKFGREKQTCVYFLCIPAQRDLKR